MCDCYDHKCDVCGTGIPIHIGDFNYPREDVEAWCNHHAKPGPGIEVFRQTENVFYDKDNHYPKGSKIAIRLKGGTLRPSDEDVEPNTGCSVSISWNGAKP